MMYTTHKAATLPEKGAPLTIVERETSEPGPDEILIQVKAVALNPIDYYQRDFGVPPIAQYPTVPGSDAAGLIVKVGSNVENAPPPGTRVIAFASGFYQNNAPQYGAFQEYVLALRQGVVLLPDHLSFEQGAVLPLAVATAKAAWTSVGIPLTTKYAPQDKQAVLIWGASSSVGTLAVQSAKSLGFTVYATASSQHHSYITKLGASKVFDYKSIDVVSQIVSAVKADGTNLNTAHVVVEGALRQTLDVLKETKGTAEGRVAHSPVLPEGHPTLENTVIKFTMAPSDSATRKEHVRQAFQEWLAPGLASGSVVPSPEPKIQLGGLGGLNGALDVLKAGVSGAKIVVSI